MYAIAVYYSTDDNNDKLLELLRKTDKKRRSYILIFGDFNFKEIIWEENHVRASDNHPAASRFYETTQDLYLIQHIEFPTRDREGQKSSRLALIFTKEEFMVEYLTDIAQIEKKRSCWSHMDICLQFRHFNQRR